MERYFLTEERRLHQKNPYVPLYIIGYGKGEVDNMLDYIYGIEYSPFAEVLIKGFQTNKEYHRYIKEMQKRGTIVKYNGRIRYGRV